MNDDLAAYYFAHDEMFVVPIEHLDANGMSDAFAGWLEANKERIPL